MALAWGHPMGHQGWGIPLWCLSPLGTKDGKGGPLQCHRLPWGPPPCSLGMGGSPLGVTSHPRDPLGHRAQRWGSLSLPLPTPGTPRQGPGMEMGVLSGCHHPPWGPHLGTRDKGSPFRCHHFPRDPCWAPGMAMGIPPCCHNPCWGPPSDTRVWDPPLPRGATTRPGDPFWAPGTEDPLLVPPRPQGPPLGAWDGDGDPSLMPQSLLGIPPSDTRGGGNPSGCQHLPWGPPHLGHQGLRQGIPPAP